MAKKKQTDGIIQDTSAPPMICDLNAPDEDRTIEGLLRMERNFTPSDNTTVSFRIPTDLLDHAKAVARTLSAEQNRDIHYQKLILESFIRVHPMEKK